MNVVLAFNSAVNIGFDLTILNHNTITLKIITLQKCSLCRINDATKPNSHIFPFGLIKDAISQMGKKGRDFEVTFGISADETTVFYGKNVLPEFIEKLNGQGLSDEDREANVNPLSRDNYLCPECETKISQLESSFSDRIYNKADTLINGITEKDYHGNKTLKLNPFQGNLLKLLAYSIFWRCSVTRHEGFKLSPKFEEQLRVILWTLLRKNIKELENELQNDLSTQLIHPVIATYWERSEQDFTENIILVNDSKIPYFVIVNRLTFQLFEKPSHINAANEHFYGLSSLVKVQELYKKMNADKKFQVLILTNDERSRIINNANSWIAWKKNQKTLKQFDIAHKHIFGLEAPSIVKASFFKNYLKFATTELNLNDHEIFVKAFYEMICEFDGCKIEDLHRR